MIDRLRRLLPSQETVTRNRWLRWLGPRVLHPRLFHLSRRGVALGAAIGVFFAFITPIAQIPLSAAACVLLRANVPVAIAATLVNTPPTFGPVYYAAWRVGSWVLDEPVDESRAPPAIALVSGDPAASSPARAATVDTLAAPDASDASAPASWWSRTVATLQDIGKPLLVGTLIFAFGFSALAWSACNVVWHWRVRSRRRRRLAAAARR